MTEDPGDQAATTRADVLTAFGEVMLAVQQLEEAMVGLIGTTGELEKAVALEPDQMPDYPWEEWEQLFTLTAGALSRRLGLTDALAAEVEAAVIARNLLVHHYLRDHGQDLRSNDGRSRMRARLHAAAVRFGALQTALDSELARRMRAAGFTFDHVTPADEARRMRYYDPNVDRDVPPEPFDSSPH